MNKLIYLIPFLLGFSFACTKDVELDIEGQESKIVVNAVVMADSSLRIHLTESRSVLDVKPMNPITNASVQLYEGTTAIGSWSYIEGGVYEAQGFLPVAGKQYTLQVKAPGRAAVQAEVVVPQKMQEVELLSLDIIDGDFEDQVKARIRIKDPAETKDFYLINRVRALKSFDGEGYRIQDHRLDVLSTETTNIINTCQNFGWSGAGCKLLLTDNAFEGRSKEVLINFTAYNWDENAESVDYLVVSRVSEAYYKYMLSLYHNQLADDNPFAEPVPVFMNIKGGYGILGASSSYWMRLH